MKYLYKTICGIALIFLIALLKIILQRFFRDESPLIYNFLSLTQLIILLWVCLSLILRSVKSKQNLLLKKIFIILFIILIPELIISYYQHHPENIPKALNRSFKYYYSESASNIIQFNPGCSVYDSNLFYRLKPSATFLFDNYEFADSFKTNSLGLRDDENSLHSPEIICLGDSYAMGWGVKQNETFAELLGKISSKKILNAAMSSYGTARELKSFNQLDTSGLKFIIIQYCRNDFIENKTFLESDNLLRVSSEKAYNSTVAMHYWNKLWFPGKHIISYSKLNISRKLAEVFKPTKKSLTDSSTVKINEAAITFARLLAHSSINFEKVKVYVVDLNEKQLLNNDFLKAVDEIKNNPEFNNRFNNNLFMVPVAELITDKDYYILDSHLRPSGHRKIAELLNTLIY